jgi:hypothetical protein
MNRLVLFTLATLFCTGAAVKAASTAENVRDISRRFDAFERSVLSQIGQLSDKRDPAQAIDFMAAILQTTTDKDLPGILDQITQEDSLLRKQLADVSNNSLLSNEDRDELSKSLSSQSKPIQQLKVEVSSFRDGCLSLRNGGLDRWKAAYTSYLDIYGAAEAAKRLRKLTEEFRKSYYPNGVDPGLMAFGTNPEVPKDPQAAFQWYKARADAGDAGGESDVGSCYLRGIGVAKDPLEACKWYQCSAEHGNMSML